MYKSKIPFYNSQEESFSFFCIHKHDEALGAFQVFISSQKDTDMFVMKFKNCLNKFH